MEKITANDSKTKSADLVGDNLEQLHGLLPEAFSEGKVDFEVLKQLLGGAIGEGEEKYGLNWHGKRRARQLALTPSTGTLLPCQEDSVNWDTTQNLMIEGDNLEVLKLLQKSYAGKVKLIFIDPPYNTGNDFIYPDDYRDSIANYLEITHQVDGNGYRLTSNTEASGRFHTDWLNMMFARLHLARQLLSPDGVIFICIDDNEGPNLRLLCDEVFGEDNYVGTVAWKHTAQSKNDERYFARHYNSLIVFRRSPEADRFRLERTAGHNVNYSNPDNDPYGPWRSGDTRSPNPRPSLRFEIGTPSGKRIKPPPNGWRWNQESVREKIQTGEIIFNEDETRIIRKIYLADQEGRVPQNVWTSDEVGGTRDANRELKELFGEAIFSTAKPTGLICRALELATNPHTRDVVLDFFAGSATTAHAVLQANRKDGGNRRFLMVQFPEPTGHNDFSTISRIGEERVRRVIMNPAPNETVNPQEGFRVFRLGSTNIQVWDPGGDDLAQTLEQAVEHLKTDRTENDILFELLLKLGLDLSTRIETRNFVGKQVKTVGEGVLLACLATKIDPHEVEELAQGIVAWHSELNPAGESTLVFRDSAFTDDVAKTNLAAILQQHGLKNVRSI